MDNNPTGGATSAPRERGLLRRLLLAAQEWWYAVQCCRQLRAQLQVAQRERPDLQGVALYAHVIQGHLGLDTAEAARLVTQAEESYAHWPSPRPVTFRDVAHYLTATGLNARHGQVARDLRPVINRHLPSQW